MHMHLTSHHHSCASLLILLLAKEMERFCAFPSSSTSSASSYSFSSSSASSSSSSFSSSSASSSSSLGIWDERGREMGNSSVSSMFWKLTSAIFTFFFAMVGSIVGAITGALVGQATESGFFRGASVGAISGAVFSIDVFESTLFLWRSDESGLCCLLYMIDVISSLLSGRLVREQVGPVMFSAVQAQMNAVERSTEEVSDIFATGGTKGLSGDSVNKLPKMMITTKNIVDGSGERICCSVCLQDFQVGEMVRKLAHCQHIFHVPCIDNWLIRHASCPLCRQDL